MHAELELFDLMAQHGRPLHTRACWLGPDPLLCGSAKLPPSFYLVEEGEAHDARGRLSMPQHGLARQQGEWGSRGAALQQEAGGGANLDGVTQRSAGAVQLQARHLLGRQACGVGQRTEKGSL